MQPSPTGGGRGSTAPCRGEEVGEATRPSHVAAPSLLGADLIAPCPFLMEPSMFWVSACLDDNTLPDSLAAGGGRVSQIWSVKAVAGASEEGL